MVLFLNIIVKYVNVGLTTMIKAQERIDMLILDMLKIKDMSVPEINKTLKINSSRITKSLSYLRRFYGVECFSTKIENTKYKFGHTRETIVYCIKK